ncbi:MAG: hypothetical protein WCO66_00090 [Candidatus Absconditabacteria bacterium]
MKLQEYFTHQQDIHLSEAEKLDMYHAIMDKQTKRSFLTKRSVLHVKTFTYSSFIVVLLFGFYGMYFFQQNQSMEGDGVFLSPAGTQVQAGYIAKVVDFAGTFYIEKDGKTMQTSTINDGDVVVLQNNAQVIFNIDTGTQAKIVGPAKFTIQKKTANNFRISLMYGDYVEMKSLQTKNIQGVELSVDDILVSQGSKTSSINYQLVKQGGKHVIQNNGSKLIVMNQTSKNKTNLDSKQILAIQGNDVSLFDSFAKFAKAINNKDLSQTFSLALNTPNEEVSVSKIKPETDTNSGTISTAKVLQPLAETDILSIADTNDEDQNIPTIAAVAPSSQKSISTEKQIDVIKNKFNAQFVQSDLQEISIAYLGGEASFGAALASLESRIRQVADIFKLSYQSPKGSEKEKLSSLASKLGELKSSIDAKFSMPPKYLQNITNTQAWIKYLASQNFGQSQGATDIDITKSLPASIKF